MLSNENIARICWAATAELLAHWGHKCPGWDGLMPVSRQAMTVMSQHARLGGSAAKMHQHWSDVMRDDGWCYGEKNDAERKLHPWLCQWDNLEEGVRLCFKLHLQIMVFLALEYPEGSDFALGLVPRRLPAT